MLLAYFYLEIRLKKMGKFTKEKLLQAGLEPQSIKYCSIMLEWIGFALNFSPD